MWIHLQAPCRLELHLATVGGGGGGVVVARRAVVCRVQSAACSCAVVRL